MFRNRGLLIMLSLVVITVGYAIYDFQSEKSSENQKSEKSRILPLDKDQIEEVTLTRFDLQPDSKSSEVFKLQRTQEGWKIIAPIEEVADQNATVDFVEGMTLEKSKDLVKQGSGIDWKIYGLDKPKAALSLKLNNKSESKVLIASTKNYSGDPYLKVEGQDQVLVGNTTWLQKIEKKAFDFRDKRLLKKSAASVMQFRISRPGAKAENITLAKKDSQWTLNEKPDWSLDQTKSSEVASMLSLTNAIEITQEKDIKASDLKNFGLDQPAFRIEVELGSEKEKWQADFSVNSKKENYVLISDPKRIVKIASQDFEKFQKLDRMHFRDRRFAFNFPREDVKKVHVETSDFKADFELKNDEWKAINPDSKSNYDLDRVKAVVALVRNLDVGDFEPKSSELAQAKYKVTFESQDGKPVFAAEFGDVYQKKEKDIMKSYLLAKTSLSKTVIGVDEGSFKSMGLETLVVKKSENKEKDTKK